MAGTSVHNLMVVVVLSGLLWIIPLLSPDWQMKHVGVAGLNEVVWTASLWKCDLEVKCGKYNYKQLCNYAQSVTADNDLRLARDASCNHPLAMIIGQPFCQGFGDLYIVSLAMRLTLGLGIFCSFLSAFILYVYWHHSPKAATRNVAAIVYLIGIIIVGAGFTVYSIGGDFIEDAFMSSVSAGFTSTLTSGGMVFHSAWCGCALILVIDLIVLVIILVAMERHPTELQLNPDARKLMPTEDNHTTAGLYGATATAPYADTPGQYGFGEQPAMQPGMGMPGMQPGMGMPGMQQGMQAGMGMPGMQQGMQQGMQPAPGGAYPNPFGPGPM